MLSRLLSDTVVPVLLRVGPVRVYSYGLMVGIGFLAANCVAIKEFTRKGLGADFANQVTILAVVFGLSGSRILSLIENWGDFLKDPIEMAFSSGGLTWYGGFFLAAAAITWAAKRKGFKFFKVADALAPALILGYGVARLACHFSGDGDYGMPTNLPWGVDYAKGVVPPSVAFRIFPKIEARYPGGIVPNNTLLHPTPIYEFLACLLIFYVLWQLRKKTRPEGELFMVYLILAGTERLLVEFIRLNPRLLFGLSEAQLVSIPLIFVGILGVIFFHQKEKAGKTKTIVAEVR
ncbi:MAG: prolipoprotein diacylglyceryl transferase [Bacteroidetes bacterium]|nr:prolipoprotein diacylglyceryl transferase [Bacteroidota bacterium]